MLRYHTLSTNSCKLTKNYIKRLIKRKTLTKPIALSSYPDHPLVFARWVIFASIYSDVIIKYKISNIQTPSLSLSLFRDHNKSALLYPSERWSIFKDSNTSLSVYERPTRKSIVFSGFFSHGRQKSTRGPLWGPVPDGWSALPHMARRLSSRVPTTTRPTMVYTACVCAWALCACLSSRESREFARILEGAIFETCSRRAKDLRSVVVASIITATIVSEFIGINIKAA